MAASCAMASLLIVLFGLNSSVAIAQETEGDVDVTDDDIAELVELLALDSADDFESPGVASTETLEDGEAAMFGAAQFSLNSDSSGEGVLVGSAVSFWLDGSGTIAIDDEVSGVAIAGSATVDSVVWQLPAGAYFADGGGTERSFGERVEIIFGEGGATEVSAVATFGSSTLTQTTPAPAACAAYEAALNEDGDSPLTVEQQATFESLVGTCDDVVDEIAVDGPTFPASTTVDVLTLSVNGLAEIETPVASASVGVDAALPTAVAPLARVGANGSPQAFTWNTPTTPQACIDSGGHTTPGFGVGPLPTCESVSNAPYSYCTNADGSPDAPAGYTGPIDDACTPFVSASDPNVLIITTTDGSNGTTYFCVDGGERTPAIVTSDGVTCSTSSSGGGNSGTLPPFVLPSVVRPRDEEDEDFDPDLPDLTGPDGLPYTNVRPIEGGNHIDGGVVGHPPEDGWGVDQDSPLGPTGPTVVRASDTVTFGFTYRSWYDGGAFRESWSEFAPNSPDFFGRIDGEVVFENQSPEHDWDYDTMDGASGVIDLRGGVDGFDVGTEDDFVLDARENQNPGGVSIDVADTEHTLIARLGGQDDSVRGDNADTVSIDGGDGSDSVRLVDIDNAAVYGGAGDDELRVAVTDDSGEYIIDGGAGNDSISAEGSGVVYVGDGLDEIGASRTYENEDGDRVTVDDQIIRVRVPEGTPGFRRNDDPNGIYVVGVDIGLDDDGLKDQVFRIATGAGDVVNQEDLANFDIIQTGDGADSIRYEVDHGYSAQRSEESEVPDIVIEAEGGNDHISVISINGREVQAEGETVDQQTINPSSPTETHIDAGEGDDVVEVDVTYIIDMDRFIADYVREVGPGGIRLVGRDLNAENFTYFANRADLDPLNYMTFIGPEGVTIDLGAGNDRVILNVLMPMPRSVEGRLGMDHVIGGVTGHEHVEFVGTYLDIESDDAPPPNEPGSGGRLGQLDDHPAGTRFEFNISIKAHVGSRHRAGDLIDYGEIIDGAFVRRGSIRLGLDAPTDEEIFLSTPNLAFRDPNPDANGPGGALGFQVFGGPFASTEATLSPGDLGWPDTPNGPATDLIPSVVLDASNNHMLDATIARGYDPGVWWDPIDHALRGGGNFSGGTGAGLPDPSGDPSDGPPSTPEELEAALGRPPTNTELFDFYARTTTVRSTDGGFAGELVTYDTGEGARGISITDLETDLGVLAGHGIGGALLRNTSPDAVRFTATFWNGEEREVTVLPGQGWQFGPGHQYVPVELGVTQRHGDGMLVATSISDLSPIHLYSNPNYSDEEFGDTYYGNRTGMVRLPDEGQVTFTPPGGILGIEETSLVVETTSNLFIDDLRSQDIHDSTETAHHLFGFPAVRHVEAVLLPIGPGSFNSLVNAGRDPFAPYDYDEISAAAVPHADYNPLPRESVARLFTRRDAEGRMIHEIEIARFDRLEDDDAAYQQSQLRTAGGDLYRYTKTTYSLNEFHHDYIDLADPTGETLNREIWDYHALGSDLTELELRQRRLQLEAEIDEITASMESLEGPFGQPGGRLDRSDWLRLRRERNDLMAEYLRLEKPFYDELVTGVVAGIHGLDSYEESELVDAFGANLDERGGRIVTDLTQNGLQSLLYGATTRFQRYGAGLMPSGSVGVDGVNALPFSWPATMSNNAGRGDMISLAEGADTSAPGWDSDARAIFNRPRWEIEEMRESNDLITQLRGELAYNNRRMQDNSLPQTERLAARSAFWTVSGQLFEAMGAVGALGQVDPGVSRGGQIAKNLFDATQRMSKVSELGNLRQWVGLTAEANRIAAQNQTIARNAEANSASFRAAIVAANTNAHAKKLEITALERELTDWVGEMYERGHRSEHAQLTNQILADNAQLSNVREQREADIAAYQAQVARIDETYGDTLSQWESRRDLARTIVETSRSDTSSAGSMQFRLARALEDEAIMNDLIRRGNAIAGAVEHRMNTEADPAVARAIGLRLEDHSVLTPITNPFTGEEVLIPNPTIAAVAALPDGATPDAQTGEYSIYSVQFHDDMLGAPRPVRPTVAFPDFSIEAALAPEIAYVESQISTRLNAIDSAIDSPAVDAAVSRTVDQMHQYVADSDWDGLASLEAQLDGEPLGTRFASQIEAELRAQATADGYADTEWFGFVLETLDRVESDLNTAFRDYAQLHQLSAAYGDLEAYMFATNDAFLNDAWNEMIGANGAASNFRLVDTVPKN